MSAYTVPMEVAAALIEGDAQRTRLRMIWDGLAVEARLHLRGGRWCAEFSDRVGSHTIVMQTKVMGARS